jgi:hypothetical protein
MKKMFAFDPNLIAEVQKAGALDGALELSGADRDSTRSRAIEACTAWNQRDKVSIRAIAEATSVHRGTIQRYAAIGKALLPTFPEGPVVRDGADEAHRVLREASDTITDLTLNALLVEVAAALPAGEGSWHAITDLAQARLDAWQAVQVTLAPEGSEEESDGSEESAPRQPRSYEDRVMSHAEDLVRWAAKEGISLDVALGDFVARALIIANGDLGTEPQVALEVSEQVAGIVAPAVKQAPAEVAEVA